MIVVVDVVVNERVVVKCSSPVNLNPYGRTNDGIENGDWGMSILISVCQSISIKQHLTVVFVVHFLSLLFSKRQVGAHIPLPSLLGDTHAATQGIPHHSAATRPRPAVRGRASLPRRPRQWPTAYVVWYNGPSRTWLTCRPCDCAQLACGQAWKTRGIHLVYGRRQAPRRMGALLGSWR